VQEPGEYMDEVTTELGYSLEGRVHRVSKAENCAKIVRVLPLDLRKFDLSHAPTSLGDAIELVRRRQQALLESSKKDARDTAAEDKEERLTTTMNTLAKSLNTVLARLTVASTSIIHTAQWRNDDQHREVLRGTRQMVCHWLPCEKVGHRRREGLF
jgi:hypothetical protein